MVDLKGINLTMQTPMHVDGSIDYARPQEMINISIDGGGIRASSQNLESGAENDLAKYP